MLLFSIAYLLPETEMISRTAWKYLGCFAFLLLLLLTRAMDDWASALLACSMLVLLKVSGIEGAFQQFSQTTVWLCIGVFLLSVGVGNCGLIKRLAILVMEKFPGNYTGQLLAFSLSGLLSSPIIPSTTAKTALMAPAINESCRTLGLRKNSRPAFALWFISFMGTNILGMAFLSGSVFSVIMASFCQRHISWAAWLSYSSVWYIVCFLLSFLFCCLFFRPKEIQAGDCSAYLRQAKAALGPLTVREKQCAVILFAAILLWTTGDLHGIDSCVVTLLAVAALSGCGLLPARDVNTKALWSTTLFIGCTLSFAGQMEPLGISGLAAEWLRPLLAPIMTEPLAAVPFLVLFTYLARFIFVSQPACIAVVVSVFAPLFKACGLDLYVLAFVAGVSGACWNTVYQTPATTALIELADQAVDFNTARKGSYLYCLINLLAVMVSIPLWNFFGLL